MPRTLKDAPASRTMEPFPSEPTPMTTSDPLLEAMAPAMGNGLIQIYRLLRRHFREEAHANELTQAQNVALWRLSDGQGHRMSDIACHLELTAGACTSLIERLADRGLVERGVDPQDGRAVVIKATPAGKALVGEMLDDTQAYMMRALMHMSATERHMALGGIEVLMRALEEANTTQQ
jgi:DNA-binding MarR family transcriptional regulator